MQWGEGKAKLDRVLDNNSGQVKTCLQVHIIVFATVVLRTTMMTVFRLATDRVRAWLLAAAVTLVATPCQIGR